MSVLRNLRRVDGRGDVPSWGARPEAIAGGVNRRDRTKAARPLASSQPFCQATERSGRVGPLRFRSVSEISWDMSRQTYAPPTSSFQYLADISNVSPLTSVALELARFLRSTFR
jgi:hypothetical protein